MRTKFLLIISSVAGTLSLNAEELIQNTPLRIEQTVAARFPPALVLSPVSEGEARVLIDVDAEGRLADLMVTGYTDEAFADEAVNVLKQWRFFPQMINGEPVGVRTELRFEFAAHGKVVPLLTMDTTEHRARSGFPPSLIVRLCQARDLDQPLAVVHAVNPPHPGRSRSANQQNATVLVDFYVDEEGRPRMPALRNATEQIYANAAVNALLEWRFSPPTRRGKPVVVRVQQEFVFEDES